MSESEQEAHDEIAMSDSNQEDSERISRVELQLQDFVTQLRSLDLDGSFDLPKLEIPKNLPIHAPHAYPCEYSFSRLPSPPSSWPQAPVMLRPTPGSHTQIRGIRYADSKTYQNFSGFCAGCILPINTGAEEPGKSLVIDFETKHFVGTLLMRIKDVSALLDKSSYQQESYFDGKKRKFQAIIKGKFKTALPMSQCVTGQAFERPAGKLPGRLVVNAAIKFISTLAPQLEVTLDGNEPRFITPLVATAHTVLVEDYIRPETEMTDSDAAGSAEWTMEEMKERTDPKLEKLVNYHVYAGSTDMECDVIEPPTDVTTSILQTVEGQSELGESSTVSARMKHRKKIFNKIAASRNALPCFRTDQQYTFEFYQHLLIFTDTDDLKLDLGRALGYAGLARPLNGQPIKCMAAHKHSESTALDTLWSFDIWHHSLYGLAQQALNSDK
jgi:hypothetical protein